MGLHPAFEKTKHKIYFIFLCFESFKEYKRVTKDFENNILFNLRNLLRLNKDNKGNTIILPPTLLKRMNMGIYFGTVYIKLDINL